MVEVTIKLVKVNQEDGLGPHLRVGGQRIQQAVSDIRRLNRRGRSRVLAFRGRRHNPGHLWQLPRFNIPSESISERARLAAVKRTIVEIPFRLRQLLHSGIQAVDHLLLLCSWRHPIAQFQQLLVEARHVETRQPGLTNDLAANISKRGEEIQVVVRVVIPLLVDAPWHPSRREILGIRAPPVPRVRRLVRRIANRSSPPRFLSGITRKQVVAVRACRRRHRGKVTIADSERLCESELERDVLTVITGHRALALGLDPAVTAAAV